MKHLHSALQRGRERERERREPAAISLTNIYSFLITPQFVSFFFFCCHCQQQSQFPLLPVQPFVTHCAVRRQGNYTHTHTHTDKQDTHTHTHTAERKKQLNYAHVGRRPFYPTFPLFFFFYFLCWCFFSLGSFFVSFQSTFRILHFKPDITKWPLD